jgi:branched-chain amino acid transport system substrate-binding protein
MRGIRRILFHVVMFAIGAWMAVTGAQAEPFRIGFLTDMNGPSAIDDGPGSITAARMAIADFGGTILGRPIELLTGDHHNKPDVGLGIAKQWYTVDGVDAIMDVNNSAVALSIQELTREQNKIFLITGASSSLLTGKACSPNSVQWLTDTYSLSRAAVMPTIADGGKSWYFLTVDYAFGHALERDATSVLQANGGTVVGAAKVPYGTTDFSAYLLQARASGADVLGFANSGQDMENAVKQAHEFGVQMRLVPLLMLIMDVHSIGLDSMKGTRFADVFYWDTNDLTRAWSKRFFEAEQHMPTALQVDAYRGMLHYLKAIKAVGTTEAQVVMHQMKREPIKDVMGDGGTIREDGRVIRDLHYYEVKSPSESKQEWDYYRLIRNIPAAQVYRPLSESECPLVKK